ncbi:A24 family peptidase [Nocardioides sp.]|uniref:A24 family peptidase n=1 Tax=Nocardioides sp. TaxID=35761 RepID=UPI0031FF0869|nr:prepilin peptidase [Nocardioides sp.]
MNDLATAGVAGVLCLVAGVVVPVLISRIPEPEPEEEPAEVDAGVSPEDPKELYADIAARPGLAWKSALVSGVAGALIGLSLGWVWALLVVLPLVPVSVALAVVDWRTRLLPTRVVAPTYVLAIVMVLVVFAITHDTDDLTRAGLGWLVAGGLFFVLWFVYPPWMGYGDVRLAGVLGIALGQLGWAPLVFGVWCGFLLGGVGGSLLALLRIVERKAYPFGPFMLVGALVGILAGDAVLGGR